MKTDPALLADIKKAGRLDLAAGEASRRGYAFTLEEARAFVAEQARNSGKPLSAAQLDRIVGGASTFCIPCMSPPPFVPGFGH
jgi:hypothetical protein